MANDNWSTLIDGVRDQLARDRSNCFPFAAQDRFAASANDKGFDLGALLPIIVPIFQALTKAQQDKGFGISAGGGISTPLGGFSAGAQFGAKEFDPAVLAPIVVQLAQALSKGQQPSQQEKIFGIDDAIIIPALAGVVTAAINASNKSGQFAAPAADKGIDIGALLPVIVPFVQALSKGQQLQPQPQQEKIFGIDDALAIALVGLGTAVVGALKKGGQFAAPAADKGFDIGSLVPVIIQVVQALTK